MKLSKLKLKVTNISNIIKSETSNLPLPRFVMVGSGILLIGIIAEIIHIVSLFNQLPPQIPLWYTNPWGLKQLANPTLLWIIPAGASIVLFVNLIATRLLLKHREPLIAKLFSGTSFVVIGTLLASLHKIILVSTPGILPPLFLQTKVLIPFTLSFSLASLLSFPTLKLAKKYGLVDDPRMHKHPGMLLTKAIPRAGALPVVVAIIVTSFLFLPLSKHFVGIYLGMTVMTIIGLLDDKKDLHPYVRLGGQILAILIVVASGIGIAYIDNPFDGVLRLDNVVIPIELFGKHSIILFADLLAAIWIGWNMNMISWSNGVDGQFPGIVAVASIIVGVVSLRVANQQPDQWPVAIMAFSAAGACLGTVPFTWHKSKYLYGFGATALGLLLATLSILSGAKVATAFIVLLVPILDAVLTVFRRLRRKQNPIWGDREHLHHLLLNLGWSQRKVALFYWITCAVFGSIALYSSGKDKLLFALTAAGLVGFLILTLSRRHKENQL